MEWRINVGDGSSKALAPKASCFAAKLWAALKESFMAFIIRIRGFFLKAWKLGVDDPRKFVHGIKAGMALTLVSLFYYMRPLYDGVGGNAMWAVMTVVVVFENTVGATIYKSLNRVFATSLAGFLALGVHWVASQSGRRFEPVISCLAVFLLASAATFSRFIPTIKAKFDYGCLIFILTFSMVSVSGYRVEQLFDVANQRMATIIIGTSLVIIVTMFICPIWAGQELHALIIRNMDKIANSLDGSMDLYFGQKEEETGPDKQLGNKSLGYRCVLGSKASEESFANFARWEPAHGQFSFKHPWKQYLKVGAALRSCAYCIEALNGCINSENQAPDAVKKHLKEACERVSSTCSSITRELAKTIQTTTRSPTVDFLTKEMNVAVQELHNSLKSLPDALKEESESESESESADCDAKSARVVPLMEVIPAATFASLLIEISSRVDSVVGTVKELAEMCEFEVGGGSSSGKSTSELETVKVLERV
ncbi:unnamed protein product [Linum trigynum]|uniref:Aluminum-activated malate transporter 10 n=1 Tax=Linum trigynum TaxID=586398 RepID=A0AAV2DJU6_9ROSI